MSKSGREVRVRKLACAVSLVLTLTACAEKPKPYARSTTPPPADPALQRAQTECADQATRETATIQSQNQASQAAVGIYYKCMAAKGYPVRPTPAPTAAP